jgi:hypothetical protein
MAAFSSASFFTSSFSIGAFSFDAEPDAQPVRNPGGSGWGIEMTPIIRPEDPAVAKRRKQNNLLMILIS